MLYNSNLAAMNQSQLLHSTPWLEKQKLQLLAFLCCTGPIGEVGGKCKGAQRLRKSCHKKSPCRAMQGDSIYKWSFSK